MPKSVFTDEYEIFLDVLVKARRDAGVTQVELGKRLKKPQPWVSNIERGIRRIDVLEFVAISNAMRIDPLSLLQKFLDKSPQDFQI